MIRLHSFAKINLGLEITGKRPDNYHTLKTIFQTIDLFDTIDIKENTTGKINLSGNTPDIQWDKTNTIVRAFDVIYKNYTLNQGFDIFVGKKIPAGSGLGGGSSNAAAILLFLINYFNLQVPTPDLITMAASIGADVPFFLMGGTVLAEGIGDAMTPLDDLPHMNITLVIPNIHVSTKLIFSRFILTTSPRKSKIDIFMKSNSLSVLENHLEKMTFQLFPEIGSVKEQMKRLDYELVMMSGSGAAVFGVGPTGNLSALKKQFRNSNVFPTQSIGRKNYYTRVGAWPSGKASVFGADIQRFESSRPSHL